MSLTRHAALAGLVMAALTALAAPLLAGETRPAVPPPPPPPSRTEFPALEEVEREIARLVESARPSVVGIIARSRLEPLLDALGENVKIEGDAGGAGPIARRIGSGIVIDAEGHVVTLSSVVSGAIEVLVLTSGGDKLRARLRGVDDYSGIAVLELDQGGSPRSLLPVTFGDSDALKIGSLVTTISSPFGSPGGTPVSSFGFVSGAGVSQGPARRCPYIKFSAYAPSGGGGGPVLDTKGNLVGMLFGAGGGPHRMGEDLIRWDRPSLSDDEDRDGSAVERGPAQGSDKSIWILKSLRREGAAGGGVAFAVPGNVVHRVSDQIIRTGSIRRGWVGVKIEESEPGDVRLLEVVPGGPAEKAGLLAGDRIVSFNDAPLTSAGLLVDGISSSPPSTSVRLGVERDGRNLNMTLSLGEAPPPRARPPRVPPAAMSMRLRPPVLGIDVDVDTDDDLRADLGAPEGVGLLVQKVHEESRAQRAGMLSGDLLLEALGVPIRNLDDLRRAVRQQGPRPMEVKVIRKGKQLLLSIPPPPPTPPPHP